jgi:ligand-binding sensor domain-containing protein
MAQQPVSVPITEKDGLPDKEFYGIAEDSKGFIWLAGNSGLTRYDGKNYTTFNHPEKRGLSVFELQVDAQDRVWCINISGQVYYFEDGKLHLFKDLQNDLNGSLPSMKISDKHLVISSHSYTYIYNADSTATLIKTYKNDQAFIDPIVHREQLLFTNKGEFIEASKQHKAAVQSLPDFFSTTVIHQKGESRSVSWQDKIVLLTQNQESFKSLYVSTSKGWQHIIIPGELDNKRFIKIKTIDNQLWLVTSEGVYVCTIIDNELIIKNHFFKGTFITDVIKDRDDNFWFTTLQNGIQIIPNLHIHKIDLPDDLGMVTKTIATSSHQLIIGFNTGTLLEYDKQSNKTRNMISQSNRAVTEIVEDTFRNEYLVVHKLKSSRYKTKNLELIDKDLMLTASKKIEFIEKDSVLYVNSNTAGLFHYPNYEKNAANVSSIFIEKRGYTCLFDPIKNIRYLGMVDALVAYRSNSDKTVLKFNGENILTRAMSLGSEGGIWVATFSGGLLHIKNDKVIQHISTNEGLISDMVQQVAVDGEFLWVATKKGIQKIHPKKLQFQNLSKRDGVLSYDIHDIIVEENEIIFSSNEGIFTADKQKVFKKFRPLDVYFTGIKINKQDRDIADSYTMDVEESTMSISFNSAGYRGKSSGNYEYRMLGMDSDWFNVPAGNDLIQYGNLPEGNYTFQLRATDAAAGSNPLKEIDFKVTKVFYKNLWFWMLLTAVLVLLIVFYYKRKLRFRESEKNKQLSQLQQDKEMINLKLENLRSQMNPHFVFNALNSIQDYIVRNHKTLASDYLGKFADLIRTYLEHSVKSRITLAEEMETLEMYLELEKLRFEDKLSYQVIFDNTAIADHISIPTMLVQPYVENSLKHGLLHKKDDRQLHIIFEYCKKEELLTCSITDNGVGRKKALQIKESNPFKKDSFAVKATEDRLKLLNFGKSKNIGVKIIDLIENGSASGTKVIVTIPHKITSHESNNN